MERATLRKNGSDDGGPHPWGRTAARQGLRLPPLWRESLWPLDWLALRLSPVYLGVGVPRGDGSAVVLVPGFLGTDAYLLELYLWLRRIGYRPRMSNIGLNARCPERLAQRLIRTLERAKAETGRRVHLVGHSLGGLIARGVCARRPDLACQVICLGSPLRAARAHPLVLATVEVVRTLVWLGRANEGEGPCLTGRCGCGLAEALRRPLPQSVRHAAIYTRYDGVMDWHDTLEPQADLNYEVGGTHIGLVFNPRAYRILGHLLAEASCRC